MSRVYNSSLMLLHKSFLTFSHRIIIVELLVIVRDVGDGERIVGATVKPAVHHQEVVAILKLEERKISNYCFLVFARLSICFAIVLQIVNVIYSCSWIKEIH